MAMTPGLETLEFDLPSDHGRLATPPHFAPVLVGVVGSGNLEVMIEPAQGTACKVTVETSARGFSPIWTAVVHDFHARHRLAGVQVFIHDMGATPAVVSLRLDQAVAELKEQH